VAAGFQEWRSRRGICLGGLLLGQQAEELLAVEQGQAQVRVNVVGVHDDYVLPGYAGWEWAHGFDGGCASGCSGWGCGVGWGCRSRLGSADADGCEAGDELGFDVGQAEGREEPRDARYVNLSW
jgi:hypothetical protein